MRYLGIDFGTKKVGLALSDDAGSMGFPRGILPNDARLMSAVRALIARENVGAVVIGESKDLSGRDNPVAAAARAFADELARDSGIPVAFHSEVFTTQEALRTRARSEKTRKPKDRRPIDDSAAALILTSYLSRHDNHR